MFEWTTYDNVEPFQCVHGSDDNPKKAKEVAGSLKDSGDPDCGQSCVFDRIEGKII